MEPQPGLPPAPSSPGTPPPKTAEVPTTLVEMLPSNEAAEEAGVKPDRRSSSSSSEASKAEDLFHPVAAETSVPLVVPASPDDEAVACGDGAVVRRPDDEAVAFGDGSAVGPDDWASWPQQPAQTVDAPVATDGGAVLPGLMTQAPEVQTMPQPAAEPASAPGFDPDRIPASIFQAKQLASSSQAEWSVASNESLFSIHGARPSTDLCGFYAGESRSHLDYFYDEAMAAADSGGEPPDWKLATVTEGSPGSGRSDASSGGSSGDKVKQKAAIAFQRHESGSAGSSSNFSFAFPILPETTTSPRKREYAGGGSAMYQPLKKEVEQPPPVTSFEDMTTEERRRRTSRWWWCCCGGECCGCCWFACSWSSCFCCCCQWRRRRWCCDCRCSCPTLCRCNWCICA